MGLIMKTPHLWLHLSREWRLIQCSGSDILLPTVFWWLILGLQAFVLSDLELSGPLARLMPGLLLSANLLLSTLLIADRLWRVDAASEMLDFWRQSGCRLSGILWAKLLALWGVLLINLALLLPLLWLAFPEVANSPLGVRVWLLLGISMMVGSLGLAALSCLISALLFSLKDTGLLGMVVLLPLSVPLLLSGLAAWANVVEGTLWQPLSWQICLTALYLLVVPWVGGQWLNLTEDG
jgi:heme exporter protein CcmB